MEEESTLLQTSFYPNYRKRIFRSSRIIFCNGAWKMESNHQSDELGLWSSMQIWIKSKERRVETLLMQSYLIFHLKFYFIKDSNNFKNKHGN